MKVVLLLLVVLAGVWLWRSRQGSSTSATPPITPAQPLAMVPCRQCGVHTPSIEAIQGKQGVYCSQDHLHQSEP